MNKLYFIFCAIIISLPCSSQEDFKRFRIGILGGATFAQIDGDKLQGYHKSGGILGLRSVAMVSDRFSISTELLFNQKGSQTKDYKNSSASKRMIHTDFAEINFLMNYKDWYSSYAELYRLEIYGGISFGRLLQTKVFDNVGRELNYARLANEFESKDLAVMAGASMYMTKDLAFGFRFARSINLLFKAQESVFRELKPTSLQNYFISIYSFYLF